MLRDIFVLMMSKWNLDAQVSLLDSLPGHCEEEKIPQAPPTTGLGLDQDNLWSKFHSTSAYYFAYQSGICLQEIYEHVVGS